MYTMLHMTNYIVIFVTSFISIIALDAIWIGGIMNASYMKTLGPLLRGGSQGFTPSYGAAVVVYIALALGLTLFVGPLLLDGNLAKAMLYGAVLGFVIYATYDFTNLSILANWPLSISIIDVLWGTALIPLATGVSYAVLRLVGNIQ